MKFAGALAAGSVLSFVLGSQAPSMAWTMGAQLPVLWAASLVHIDATHLAMNLLGLLLVQAAFGPLLDRRAWCFAVLVAAPLAHLTAVGTGHLAWVAGLSSALHAAVAFALAAAFAHAPIQGTRGLRLFTGLAAIGLVLKIVLDLWLVTRWPAVGAQSSASLHALAATAGGLGGLLAARVDRVAAASKGLHHARVSMQ